MRLLKCVVGCGGVFLSVFLAVIVDVVYVCRVLFVECIFHLFVDSKEKGCLLNIARYVIYVGCSCVNSGIQIINSSKMLYGTAITWSVECLK